MSRAHFASVHGFQAETQTAHDALDVTHGALHEAVALALRDWLVSGMTSIPSSVSLFKINLVCPKS